MKHLSAIILIIILLGSANRLVAQNRKLEKADHYYSVGEYTKAMELYRKLYSKSKNRTERAQLAYKLGMAAKKLDQVNLELTWFKRALANRYPNPEIYLLIADAYKFYGYYDDAIEYYREFQNLVPDDPRGASGIQSCTMAKQWLNHPTRYVVNFLYRVNSRYNDFAPAMSSNDTTVLYFTSMKNASKGKNINPSSGASFADVYVTRMDKKGVWSVPEPIAGEVNTQDDEGSCYVSPDGLTMFFTRCQNVKDANLGCKIYVAYLKEGRWVVDHEVKLFADSSISVGQPWLTPDLLTMYFVAETPQGIGGKDIWVVTRRSKSADWGVPKLLSSEINTAEDELFPSLDQDGNLYFASKGHDGMGGFDIFKATKDENGNWSVTNLKYPINSPANDYGICFVTPKSGYLASNREYKYGDDIYYFYEKPLKIILAGQVFNDKTKMTVEGVAIKIQGSDGRNINLKTNAAGNFKTRLNENTDYFLITEKEGFLRSKISLTTKGINNDTTINLELYIKPMDQIVKIPNIRYFFNDTTLRPESKVALDKLIELLKLNPNIKIEIMAHTDYRGSEEYNLRLSQGRANSVVKYLVDHGIDPKRLVAKGYGETKPFVVDKETAKEYPFLKEGQVLTQQFIESLPDKKEQEICNELNRRTEFRVLGKIVEYKKFGEVN